MTEDEKVAMLANAVDAYQRAVNVLEEAKTPAIVTAGIAMDLWKIVIDQLIEAGHTYEEVVPQSVVWAGLVKDVREELNRQAKTAVH